MAPATAAQTTKRPADGLTDDGHHIVVDGRKWRATDPSIPEPLRVELVAELMAARREVHAQRDDAGLVRKARVRVSHAKHALGERGEPWWQEPTDVGLDARIRATIFSLITKRGVDATICPSEAARVVGSPDWRPLMDRVRAVATQLARAGDVVISSSGTPVDSGSDVAGPIRIGLEADA